MDSFLDPFCGSRTIRSNSHMVRDVDFAAVHRTYVHILV